jgi:hypothetical protein
MSHRVGRVLYFCAVLIFILDNCCCVYCGLKQFRIISIDYICLVTDWTTGRSKFDPRQRRKDFSCSLCVQTGSGAHPAFCTIGTAGPFPGAKARPGRDADHSPPSSAVVMNEYELYTSLPKRLRGV